MLCLPDKPKPVNGGCTTETPAERRLRQQREGDPNHPDYKPEEDDESEKPKPKENEENTTDV